MSWKLIAPLNSLADEAVAGFEIEGTPIAIYRIGDAVYATHGICTHALAYLSQGWLENGEIECPLHQGRFDVRSGKALCSPVTEDLKTYPTKCEDGNVYVDIGGQDTTKQAGNDTSTSEASSESLPEASGESAELSSIVIIGAGQAGAAAAISLRQQGYRGDIHLVGKETHLPYERPPLSKEVLAGDGEYQPTECLTRQQAQELRVTLHLGRTATEILPQTRQISLDSGTRLSYDALLLTTGGSARTLPIPGGDLPGVHYLRTLEDAAKIRSSLKKARRIVVIGGGFIGLELASSAVAHGKRGVILLEREPELMTRLMPREIGSAFRAIAERHGVSVLCQAAVSEIMPAGSDGMRISTSRGEIQADAVFVGVGLQPDTALALHAGCACDGGVIVDNDGRTSVPNIWAAGDVAVLKDSASGKYLALESWQNANEQGIAAAHSILGGTHENRKTPWFWTSQFGFDIQILGVPSVHARVESSDETPIAGSVCRTFNADCDQPESVIAFSNPMEIRKARAQMQSRTMPPDTTPEHPTARPNASPLAKEETKMTTQLSKPERIWEAGNLTDIPDWIYTDQSVYDLEVERIFHGKTWNYVAFEQEVPEPGSYIRSHVGPTPVVVARADDGSINVFENRCSHRAAEFCRPLKGKTKEFVCPYHQWSYDLKGNLAGIPFRRGVNGKGGMPKDFKPADHGPRKLKVTTHRGVVFASYADDVEPLQDYFGPEVMKEFEATFDGRKLRILGHYRHSLPGNWKLYHENLRDPYHATLLHTFLVTFGLLSPGNKNMMFMDESGRHGIMASSKSDATKMSSDTKSEMRAYREDMRLKETRFMDFIEEFKSPWSVIMATIWPNLIIQREMNTLGIRQIVPTGPNEFIMKWTMFGFEDDSEEMTRHRLRQGNLMGPAGFLGLEDNEAIKFVQDGMLRVPNKKHIVRLDPENPAGTSDSVISESAIRAMYRYWRKEMNI